MDVIKKDTYRNFTFENPRAVEVSSNEGFNTVLEAQLLVRIVGENDADGNATSTRKLIEETRAPVTKVEDSLNHLSGWGFIQITEQGAKGDIHRMAVPTLDGKEAASKLVASLKREKRAN